MKRLALSKIFCTTVLILNTMGFAGNSKRLYDLCCEDNMFFLDSQLYKQVDGAPIGDCVSIRFARRNVHEASLWGIPLQSVVNFCCPLGRAHTVGGATMAKAEPLTQHFFN